MKTLALSLILVIALFGVGLTALAQQDQPAGAFYTIQEGDTLGVIARRFGVDLDLLMQENGISNPNLISAGERLAIPGLSDIQGELTTIQLPFGENLTSLSRRYGLSSLQIAKINRITSPVELFAGADLVIPIGPGVLPKYDRELIPPGATLLELAALKNANLWSLLDLNQVSSSTQILAGDVLLFQGAEQDGPGALPGSVAGIEIEPLPLRQGRTGVIKLLGQQGLQVSGTLLDRPLNFFSSPEGAYAAIHGVHAMTEPGFYNLALSVQQDGFTYAFTQRIGVGIVNYPFDKPLKVDPATIDPAVTLPEDEQWKSLMMPATPTREWVGFFSLPSPLPVEYCLETNDCWTSRFGNRRSYNGSEYKYFHTGLDIAGREGVEITAPAPGIVVFTGPLTVRGNATIIDHGWGIYSAYMHQSSMSVEAGQRVETGQVIGLVGATGRVEGPHLHWEIWAGGVQVDPLEWLQREFP